MNTDAVARANRLQDALGEANETIRTLRGDLAAEKATNKVLLRDVERFNRIQAKLTSKICMTPCNGPGGDYPCDYPRCIA